MTRLPAETFEMIEIAPLAECSGYYVGTDGNVFSCYVWGGRLTDRIQRILVPQRDGLRLQVAVRDPSGKRRTFKIAPLVLRTFVGPPSPGQEASHVNGASGTIG